MQKNKPKKRKPYTRTPKEIHITVLPDSNQTEAIKFIKLFGLSKPPVFENVAETTDGVL